MEFLDFLSLSAIFSTIGLFLCGIPICQTIARKGSTDGISAAPFLLGTIGCVFWLRYGLLKGDSTIMIVNGTGLFLEAVYIVYYYSYARPKTMITRQIILITALGAFMLVYVHLYEAVPDVALQHLGMMCMTLNILNFAAPLTGLRDVLRIQSTENLPLPLCAANLLVSAQWFWYGLLVDDLYIKVPNFVGIILAIIQLSLFLIYPRTRSHVG